jgi:hypothetical protein
MAASQSGLFNLQLLASDGTLAASYRLYTYATGTTTLKTAYTEPTGTTSHSYTPDGTGLPNGQYIALNARGELPSPLYWRTGSADLCLKTPAGATVWTMRADPIGDGAAALDTALRADLASTASATLGDYLLGVKSTLTGGVARTQHSKNADVVSVLDFGANTTPGTTDMTAAIIAALAASDDVTLPPGTYKVTSKITVGERKRLRGSGRYGTIILFAPTANGTCIEVSNGASIVDQGSVSDLAIRSDDSTYTKVALDVIDGNSQCVERITVGGSIVVSGSTYWSGASSIGLRVQGRQTFSARDIDIAADRPIVIATNPNDQISADHFNFHNLYLIANANPVVELLTGVNLMQMSFTGYQAWVRGTAGLKWTDTTSTLVSNGLELSNVRWEQGTDATAYSVDISHNTGLQGLTIRRGYGGIDRRGVKLRKVEDVYLDGHYHGGATVALDVDATVKRITGSACFFQASSTATLTGQRYVRASPLNPNTGALPPDFFLDEAANSSRDEMHDGVISSTPFALANNGIAAIAGASSSVVLEVFAKNDSYGRFFLKGSAHTVQELSDPDAVFSVTATTGSSTNVYWSAGNNRYEIENKRGSSLTYVVVSVGSYS